jgi:hypothetical protein
VIILKKAQAGKPRLSPDRFEQIRAMLFQEAAQKIILTCNSERSEESLGKYRIRDSYLTPSLGLDPPGLLAYAQSSIFAILQKLSSPSAPQNDNFGDF